MRVNLASLKLLYTLTYKKAWELNISKFAISSQMAILFNFVALEILKMHRQYRYNKRILADKIQMNRKVI